MLPIVRSLVARGQLLASVGEYARAACVLSLPDPDAVLPCQCFNERIALTIEEVRPILLGRGVVSDDLEAADLYRSDAAVCGMHHESAARSPQVDVAGDDLIGSAFGIRYGLSFGDPATDEHAESIEFGRAGRCLRAPGRHPVRRRDSTSGSALDGSSPCHLNSPLISTETDRS